MNDPIVTYRVGGREYPMDPPPKKKSRARRPYKVSVTERREGSVVVEATSSVAAMEVAKTLPLSEFTYGGPNYGTLRASKFRPSKDSDQTETPTAATPAPKGIPRPGPPDAPMQADPDFCPHFSGGLQCALAPDHDGPVHINCRYDTWPRHLPLLSTEDPADLPLLEHGTQIWFRLPDGGRTLMVVHTYSVSASQQIDALLVDKISLERRNSCLISRLP